ncbi:MAG: hypothetical protein ACK5U8_05055, partial [Deltaproteobacteria bacterium]
MHSSRSFRLAIASLLAAAGLAIPTAPTRAQTLEEEMAQTEGGGPDPATEDSASSETGAPTDGGHQLNDDQAVYEERTGGREALGPSETD